MNKYLCLALLLFFSSASAFAGSGKHAIGNGMGVPKPQRAESAPAAASAPPMDEGAWARKLRTQELEGIFKGQGLAPADARRAAEKIGSRMDLEAGIEIGKILQKLTPAEEQKLQKTLEAQFPDYYDHVFRWAAKIEEQHKKGTPLEKLLILGPDAKVFWDPSGQEYTEEKKELLMGVIQGLNKK